MKGHFDGKNGPFPAVNIFTATQQLAALVHGDAKWGVLDGVHTVATWQIRLNHPCVAVTWPYAKIL